MVRIHRLPLARGGVIARDLTTMLDEEGLTRKLRAIEALIAGATTDGEREAADRARERIRARLVEQQGQAMHEYQYRVDRWTGWLLGALAHRHGLEVYRYPRQRRTTLVVKAPEHFMRGTFHPMYVQMKKTLQQHLMDLTHRVIKEALDPDMSEPKVVDDEPRLLAAALAEPSEE
jgi:hypothetical protein